MKKFKMTGNSVELVVNYGLGGKLDCEKAADTYACVFTEKLMAPIKGSINPGDSTCGIIFTAEDEPTANTLLGLLKERFENPDGRTARDFFDLGDDIIQIELPEQDQESARYLWVEIADDKSLKAASYGEDRENSLFVDVGNTGKDYYGEALAEVFRIPERDALRVRFTIIPESRLEEIKKHGAAMGLDLLALGKRLAEIKTRTPHETAYIEPGTGTCGIIPDRKIIPSYVICAPPKEAVIPEKEKPAPEKSTEEIAEILKNFFGAAAGKRGKVSQKEMEGLEKKAKPFLDPSGQIRREIFIKLPRELRRELAPLVLEYAASMGMGK
jgi:hypothetical protein